MEIVPAERHSMTFGIKSGSRWFQGMWDYCLAYGLNPEWRISDYGLIYEVDLTAERVRRFIQKYGEDITMICDYDHCFDRTKPDFGYIEGDL